LLPAYRAGAASAPPRQDAWRRVATDDWTTPASPFASPGNRLPQAAHPSECCAHRGMAHRCPGAGACFHWQHTFHAYGRTYCFDDNGVSGHRAGFSYLLARVKTSWFGDIISSCYSANRASTFYLIDNVRMPQQHQLPQPLPIRGSSVGTIQIDGTLPKHRAPAAPLSPYRYTFTARTRVTRGAHAAARCCPCAPCHFALLRMRCARYARPEVLACRVTKTGIPTPEDRF